MEIVRGFALQDAWNQNPSRPTYIYHSSNGATRIDSFYVSTELQQQKIGIEIMPAAFTDYHAVAPHIQINDTDLKRGRGRWKIESTLMTDEHLKRRIRTERVKWLILIP